MTSARQDHTSDTPDGCHNKENGNALMVKLLITWANYRQSSRTTGWTPRRKLQGACNRREPRRRSQVTQTKGVQGHQVQRPSDAAPTQHVNAHARFISLRDRSINLPTYGTTHRYQHDRTDGDTQGFDAARMTTCRNAHWHRAVSTRTSTEESWINLPD